MPSLGSGAAVAVASTTLSPLLTSAAPPACLAIRPVSNLICLPPASSTVTSCFMVRLFSILLCRYWNLLLRRLRARAGTQPSRTGNMAAGALQGNVCPGLDEQGNYGHGRGHAADAGRVRSPPGLRSSQSALVPHQQLQRHGRERPCAKGKMTAGVGRAL